MADEKKSPSLKDKGIFLISKNFDNELTKDVVTWIFESNFDEKREYKNLTLMINSHGGSVDAGFAIIDAIKGSSIPVHTIGIGCIASMGLLTFLAGAKGHRALTPNTTIMSHQFWSFNIGKEHELLAAQKDYDLTSIKVMRHYKQTTGLSEQKIKETLLPPHDVYLSAAEALDYGICDEIRNMGY